MEVYLRAILDVALFSGLVVTDRLKSMLKATKERGSIDRMTWLLTPMGISTLLIPMPIEPKILMGQSIASLR